VRLYPNLHLTTLIGGLFCGAGASKTLIVAMVVPLVRRFRSTCVVNRVRQNHLKKGLKTLKVFRHRPIY